MKGIMPGTSSLNSPYVVVWQIHTIFRLTIIVIGWYRERDNVWESVADNLKERLAKQNIFGIAQALAVQKFSKEKVVKRSKGILKNLKNANFDLSEKV